MVLDTKDPSCDYYGTGLEGVCCVSPTEEVEVIADRPGVFTESAIFERISHFTDHGVPGTLKDPFNRAAIADGSCRAVGMMTSRDTYFGSLARVDKVITAMQGLPGTDRPSYFTI